MRLRTMGLTVATAALLVAPAADLRAHAEELKTDRPWKRRLDRGYPEYGAFMRALLGALAVVMVPALAFARLNGG